MNIILCGFMGCGKTSIGWRTARLTNYKFIDMDSYIVEKQRMSITEIFSTKGESEFRRLETQAATELSKQTNLIIACGGGTVLNPMNVDILKSSGKVIFLDVPLPAIQERLKRDFRRPLLQRPDRHEFIQTFYAERYPKYLAVADMVVMAGAPAIVVARNIAKIITEHNNA